MLCENNLPKHFSPKVINSSCYISNRCFIRSMLRKNPYKFWIGRKPNIGFLYAFGCKCFILDNAKENLAIHLRSDEENFCCHCIIRKA